MHPALGAAISEDLQANRQMKPSAAAARRQTHGTAQSC